MYWKGLCFGVKMFNGRHLHAAGGDAKGVVLEDLELGDMGGGGVGKPNGSYIQEKGPNYGFIYDGYCFGLLAPGGASKSL